MSTTRSTIIWSLIWNLLEKCSVQIVSFVVTIVLSRLLMPEEYGIVALITIFIALANVIIDGGLNTALVQRKDTDNLDFSTIFIVSIVLSIILYTIMFFIAPLISAFYGIPDLTDVIRVISISLVFYAFNSVQRAYIYKKMLFRKMFLCSLMSVILSGTIGITMAYFALGIWALVVQTVLNIAFSAIFMWFIVKWRPILKFSSERFKILFDFGWKIFLSNFIVTLFIKMRSLFIGKLFSPATLAYYDKGNQFPGLIMDNVCGTIQTVMFPVFSQIQDDRERIKSMMRRSINISCLFMFPLMIGLISCSKPMVILLLTEKWLPCVPYIQILCLANFFRPISIPNVQAITAMGYSNITLKLEIIRKVVDVIILAISCYFGAIGIAWGVVLFNVICLFINLYPNKVLLNYKISEQAKDVLPMFAISIFMGFVIYPLILCNISPVMQIIAQILIGIIVYIGLCFIFKIKSFIYLIDMIKNNNIE